jgi:hypothetical protein
MAKVPDNRYQNIVELVEDLTIASGMIMPVPVSPVASTTTATNAVRSDDADEITVVRPREQYPASGQYAAAGGQPAQVQVPGQYAAAAQDQYSSGPRRAPVPVPVQPAAAGAAGGFNPWKILIPSAVALLVIFAAIYALTKNPTSPSTNANQPAPTLAADPNSQPVQAAQPPTGKAEEGLPSGGAVKPSANVNASPNVNAEEIQTPIADVSPTANENANSNANSNSNSNSKAPPLPEPTRSVKPDTAPPPSLPTPKPATPTPSPNQR